MKRLLYYKEEFYQAFIKPFKKLRERIKRTGGRNNTGKITVFHRGGGSRKLYRKIDNKYHIWWLPGKIEWISKDPNRTGWISTINYENGIITHILAYENSMLNEEIINGPVENIKSGIGGFLKDIKIGAKLYNVEKKVNEGGKIARAAGTYAVILRKSKTGVVVLKTKKKKLILSRLNCAGTYGIVSNSKNQEKSWKKAGKSRRKGIRPTVRGVAMNPIDHPHGGGEGKSKGGDHPKTPWGKLTKGKRTTTLKKKRRIKFLLSRVFK